MSAGRAVVQLVGDWLEVGPGLAALALALLVFLSGGTLVRGWARWRRGDSTARRRWRSVATWWILTALFLALLALGPVAVVVTMAALSVLLLREALRLVDEEQLLPSGIVLVLAAYVWSWMDRESLFLAVLPTLVAIVAGLEIFGREGGAETSSPEARPRLLSRARRVGRALFLALIGPSYTVAVAFLPAPPDLPDSGMGWFALLFVLTELNDSAQAWGGRAFGTRRMAPRLSPGKTWAGFWSGLLTTAAAAVIVAPVTTSYGRVLPGLSPMESAGSAVPSGAVGADAGSGWLWLVSAGLGIVIAVAGICGDLLESSLKREAGVKDSGDLLPGHGGLMDRFDSLALTAPIFFALTWSLWF